MENEAEPDHNQELRDARLKLAKTKAGQGGEDAQRFIPTTELAKMFGVTRKSIYEWRKEGRDGVPEKVDGKEDVDAWRAWFNVNPSAGSSNRSPRKDRETLLCEKLEVEIELANVKLRRATRELMPVAEARETATRVYSVVKAELLKMTNELPPSIAGLAEVDIQTKLRAAVVAILEELSSETNKAFDEPEKGDDDDG